MKRKMGMKRGRRKDKSRVEGEKDGRGRRGGERKAANSHGFWLYNMYL